MPRRHPRGTSDQARGRKVGVPEIMGEYIDRQVNIEMLDDTYPRRGQTQAPYEAARARQGAPLTYLAAKGLIGVLIRRTAS